jgi:hypothetical protein
MPSRCNSPALGAFHMVAYTHATLQVEGAGNMLGSTALNNPAMPSSQAGTKSLAQRL